MTCSRRVGVSFESFQNKNMPQWRFSPKFIFSKKFSCFQLEFTIGFFSSSCSRLAEVNKQIALQEVDARDVSYGKEWLNIRVQWILYWKEDGLSEIPLIMFNILSGLCWYKISRLWAIKVRIEVPIHFSHSHPCGCFFVSWWKLSQTMPKNNVIS